MGARPDWRPRPRDSSSERGSHPEQYGAYASIESTVHGGIGSRFRFHRSQGAALRRDGGYETVHESRRLQVYVYVLVAPEPDHERVNAHSKIYIVLEGRGMLDVDGERLALREGRAAFVPAHANHVFSAYEYLTVLAIRSGPDVGL